MAFDKILAERVRKYLDGFPNVNVQEKPMFGGLAFMVNGKMCINVSGDNLMCRFDPQLHESIFHKTGCEKMIMKGRELKGYCYVKHDGFKSDQDFDFWMDLCLSYNKKAKSSKK
ncbi:MAG TPA: TfoX/Sxy family protein [Lentimicrobium sp.]|nr:TfoX/Sxy family protein [Lentimicrobium sp.]